MSISAENHKVLLIYRADTGAVQSLVHIRLMPGAADPGEQATRQDALDCVKGSMGSASARENLRALEIDPTTLRPGAVYVVDPSTQSVRVTERKAPERPAAQPSTAAR